MLGQVRRGIRDGLREQLKNRVAVEKIQYIKFPSCIVEINILKNSISTPSSL